MGRFFCLSEADIEFRQAGVLKRGRGTAVVLVKDDGSICIHNLQQGVRPDFWSMGRHGKIHLEADRLRIEVTQPGESLSIVGHVDAMSHINSTWFDSAIEKDSSEKDSSAPERITTSGPAAVIDDLDEGTLGPDERPVFEALRKWRLAVAKANSLPPYVIAHDKTLRAIVRARPRSRDQLAGVPGVGRTRAERYGDQIIDIVART